MGGLLGWEGVRGVMVGIRRGRIEAGEEVTAKRVVVLDLVIVMTGIGVIIIIIIDVVVVMVIIDGLIIGFREGRIEAARE